MQNLMRLAVAAGTVAAAILVIAIGLARNSAELLAPVNLLLFLAGTAIYLLPSGLAVHRDCKSALWIFLMNVFLGWTVLGWFAALGWAAAGEIRRQPANILPPAHTVAGH